MSRGSLLRLFLYTGVRRKRFLALLGAFAALSALMAFLDYRSFRLGYDAGPYETFFTTTFNLIVVASIIFAGDLVSEDFGSYVKYVLLQLGDRVTIAFSKLAVALLMASLVGYVIPVAAQLAVIAYFRGVPDLSYVGALYLYVVAYTSLNAMVSALLYEKGGKGTMTANIVIWLVVYYIYTNAVMSVSALRRFYYTSLPMLAEGLYRYYTSFSYGFYAIKPSFAYSLIAPVIATAASLAVTYLAVRGVRV